jgi:hypothetical protein
MLFANSRVLHSLSVSSVPSVYPLRNKKKVFDGGRIEAEEGGVGEMGRVVQRGTLLMQTAEYGMSNSRTAEVQVSEMFSVIKRSCTHRSIKS